MLKKVYQFLFEVDLNEPAMQTAGMVPQSWKSKLVKEVTCVVLFSYLALILHAVMPVMADILAHTFWEKEHLASEHHQYGKNHVAAELAKRDKQDGKDKGTGSSKTNTEDYSHVLVNHSGLRPTVSQAVKQAYRTYHLMYTATCLDTEYKPPRV